MPKLEEASAPTVSDQVKGLYDDVGWTVVGNVTYDAQTSEDLRASAEEYVSACRLRVLRHLPSCGERLLDMASGPIQYREYLRYSDNFAKRVCVDLSERGLAMAKAKLGNRGEYLQGDFLELGIPENSFDAVVSLHTIYHIDSVRQALAVRKLLNVAKPEAPIVIVYSNPMYPVSAVLGPVRRLLSRSKGPLYFHRFPLSWWKQFQDEADLDIFPWRSFSTREQRLLFPDNAIGKKLFAWLYALEERFPRFFVAIGCYPMIVLRKRRSPSRC